MAPEALHAKNYYTPKIDVFSLACTLVETFCSKARSTPCKREMPLRSPATAKTPAARICRKRLDVATVLLCGGVSVALKHERLVLLVV
jgi:serine/threonine protein kinase